MFFKIVLFHIKQFPNHKFIFFLSFVQSFSKLINKINKYPLKIVFILKTETCRVNIPIKNLPSSFDGYKVALLTDVHIGPTVGLTSVERVVELTNEIDAGTKTMFYLKYINRKNKVLLTLVQKFKPSKRWITLC